MKQYDDYQVVAQKWVDEIPEHWDFYRIKRIFAQRVEKKRPRNHRKHPVLNGKTGCRAYCRKRGSWRK